MNAFKHSEHHPPGEKGGNVSKRFLLKMGTFAAGTKALHGIKSGSPMSVGVNRQNNIVEKPTVMLCTYTYRYRHVGTVHRNQNELLVGAFIDGFARVSTKKNLNAPRPSEHPPLSGKKMSKRLGGVIGCKDKNSSWHLIRFPNGSNIGSTA